MARIGPADRIHVCHRGTLSLPLTARRYSQQIDTKPQGFWWGVGTSWMEWCEAEEFGITMGCHVYRLQCDIPKCLRISTVEEMDSFDEIYRATLPGMETFSPRYIDWRQVAAQWDGIEIAPYLWDRRLGPKCGWYYGWDCASGVTWKPKSVIRTLAHIGNWQPGALPGLIPVSKEASCQCSH
jgi:hypothetical protein